MLLIFVVYRDLREEKYSRVSETNLTTENLLVFGPLEALK